MVANKISSSRSINDLRSVEGIGILDREKLDVPRLTAGATLLPRIKCRIRTKSLSNSNNFFSAKIIPVCFSPAKQKYPGQVVIQKIVKRSSLVHISQKG